MWVYYTQQGASMHYVTEKIEKLRIQHGWTIYRLAQETGLSETAIHRWISTETCPSIPALSTICDSFKMSMSDFFDDGRCAKNILAVCPLARHQQQQVISDLVKTLAAERRV